MARRGAQQLGRTGERPSAAREHEHAPPPRRSTDWIRDDGAPNEWSDTAPDPSRSCPRGRTRADAPAPAGKPSRGAAKGMLRPAGRGRARLLGRGRARPWPARERPTLPPELATAIRNAADTATLCHRERLVEQAEAAYGAYERGRFLDAWGGIKPVADEAPAVAAVRELAGLAAYRNGRWRDASRHLQAYGQMTGATEHLPVVMDCQRALRKPKKVTELWSELRHSSPDPDVLAEGRIVAAASLADVGRPPGRHRHAGRRPGRPRRCATPRSATSGSGTCWATSTSGPATSRGPASTSSGCGKADPEAYDVADAPARPGPGAPRRRAARAGAAPDGRARARARRQ